MGVAAPAEASGPHTHVSPANEEKHADAVDGPAQWLDVTDGHGAGSVGVEVGRATSDPLGAADDEVCAEGNCAASRRPVRVGGAVLRVCPVVVGNPFQSLSQVVRLHPPTGEVCKTTVRNSGSADFTPQEDRRAFNRTGTGRGALPSTEGRSTAIRSGGVRRALTAFSLRSQQVTSIE